MLTSIAKLCCMTAAVLGPFASGGLVTASITGAGAGAGDILTAFIGWSVGVLGIFGFSAIERAEDRRVSHLLRNREG